MEEYLFSTCARQKEVTKSFLTYFSMHGIGVTSFSVWAAFKKNSELVSGLQPQQQCLEFRHFAESF